MTKRSPYDISFPAPSEELLGVLHGISRGSITAEIGVDVIKVWMKRHLDESQIEHMEKRDPLWEFNKESSDLSMILFIEWGQRIKNGKFLTPLPGMKYKPRLCCVK